MELIKVDSSNIDKLGYENETLYVLFKNGGLYKYNSVPLFHYQEIIKAESVGKYLNKEIKKIFECVRLWDDDPEYIDIVG
jgi:hypothetical protein